MTILLQELQQCMDADEGEHLEFKEAKSNFHFEKLVKYCAALANEGGGRFVLGVTDKKPRRVVGSQAFTDLPRTKAGLIERLRLRIEAEEIAHPDGRVVVITVPARPLGVPVAVEGAYWMRSGEDLAPMTPDMLKRIFEEAEPDFSAEVCSEAALDDLDPAAIRQFRSRWAKKSKNKSLAGLPAEQLLADAELVVSKGVTYAALILLAKARSLGRLLAQAEVIFEYRSTEAAGPANQREEFRQGFFLFYDRLWDLIDLRNDRQHFQEGFFMNEIPTFSEGSVREAILNAVSHRDYRHPGSVFIRQFPRRVEIVSPGGFPPGISPENILDEQLPRNRRIAETFARCDLVERAGQGVNRMFEECIRQGKPLPDYSGSNDYHVLLRLRGQIQDENFLRFLDRVGDERLRAFSTHDFLVIDLVHREQPVPEGLLLNVQMLVEQGIIESVPRARTRQYRLSPQYYELRRKETTAPGKRGTAREKDKAIALRILKSRKKTGVRLREFRAALPELSRDQVHRLMQSLRIEGLAHNRGSTRASLWFLGPAPKIARPGKKPRNRRA